MTPAIPAHINEMSLLEAAHFYHGTLGWAVHPLLGPDRGDGKSRGKKPLLKGWREHTAADVTPEDLNKVFTSKAKRNLGCVVRPPFVHVDLDSKPDKGASVRAWLELQPNLANVPRERTNGGAHLAFLCHDLPECLLKARSPLVSVISEKVTAELYTDGLNLVLSPSIHHSGARYQWEVVGEIPEVKWGQLAAWFGFSLPEKKKRGRTWDPAKWWLRYMGDLRTLNITAMCQELGWLGRCVDADKGMHAVRCPWSQEHSNHQPDAEPGSDTILFEGAAGQRYPAFKCQHAHCSERRIEQFLEATEAAVPGIVERHCARIRQPGAVQLAPSALPAWEVPNGASRLQVEAIRELGGFIAPHHTMFLFSGEIVRLLDHRRQPYFTRRRESEERNDYNTHVVQPEQFVTAIESFCRPVAQRINKDGEQTLVGTVLSSVSAKNTLGSAELAAELPELRRVLRSPVPELAADNDELVFPSAGFNPDTGIFLALDAVQARPLPPSEKNIQWAKAVLGHLLAYGSGDSFAYATAQDECHSFARFLTPFCRGIMGWAKGPVWTFEADDAGTGKDTLADITHVQQTGAEIGCPPTTDPEEMRKAITSFLLNGGGFYHIGNVRGVFKSGPFEEASAAKRTYSDRELGKNKTLHLRNESEYSFSANDAVFTPDILRRCRRIFQRWPKNSINKRTFRIPGILGWVSRNRPMIATAALTLIHAYWQWRSRNTKPQQAPLFSSFTEWADIVGGLCVWAGFGDPTCPHLLDLARKDIGAPDRAEEIEYLRLFHEHKQSEWMRHGELLEWTQQNAKEIFHSVAWDKDASWKRQMGRKLAKLQGKERGPFKLECRGGEHHPSRAQYRVIRWREGDGTDDDDTPPYVGSWFTTPAILCLDKHGNIALPEQAVAASAARGMAADSAVASPTSPESANPVPAASLLQRNVPIAPGRLLSAIPDDLPALIREAGSVALDIETYGQRKGDGLDPWKGDIRLLSLRTLGNDPWLLDLRVIGYDLGALKSALESVEIIAHNAKFDLLWLHQKCGLRTTKVFCTLTASRLLTAGTQPGNNLDQCLERYCGVAPSSDQSTSDWGAMLLTDTQLAYAARDVAHLHELAVAQREQIFDAGLDGVWQLEMRLLPAVIEMEANGIAVDVQRLRSLRDEARAQTLTQTAALRESLQQPTLNPASTKQLLAALRARGIAIESTDEESLKTADDGTIIPALLAYRAAEKQAQQAETLLNAVRADGRIHGRFDPTGTTTGRFSSKEPNLQNIGRGELRSCFIASRGHRLIVADYSQIELRAAAAIAGEPKMIEAYQRGEDLHRKTAAAVLGKSPEAVTKEDRQLAKAVNFGLLYGQSAPGLQRYAASSYGVKLELEQAEQIRKAFFRTYGALRQWHGESHVKAGEGIRNVRTVLGRQRLIPSDASEWNRFTALVNTPVQGGCADGLKRAMVRLHHELPLTARLVSTVHDEFIIEVPEAETAAVREQVSTVMREAMEKLFPSVPIEVEAHVCDHWGQK